MSWVTPILHSVGDVLSAGDWNIGSNDLTFLYGDAGWTTPTLTSPWVNAGVSPLVSLGFRKVGTRVVMRGSISGGSLGSTAFTMPTGYLPTGNVRLPAASAGAYAQVNITAAGAVIPTTGSTASFGFDGVTYDTI